ncbi:MAG: tetratricopeptide repeat protein [Anaerolineae bacterium]|nr:tetratricopeptide repeat protein [Anaerolineae bacterium]
MAGNRDAYEHAMNAGHNAAWDKEWPAAIAAYGQAIQEFPDDHEAHINLGLALLEVGRLEDALRVYTRAHQLNSNDPIPLEKSADVLEKVGRLKEAAQQYINVAEIYLGQRDLDKAIYNWQQATRLTPGMVAVHAKLAQAYERLGQKPQAIREYLVLAQNFQRLAENDRALKAAQRALKLDPKSVTTLNAMRALESGSDISLPPPDKQGAAASVSSTTTSSTTLRMQPVVEADPLGPIGETMSEALTLMATFVMEGGALDASGADALQAMELQRQGINDQAILAYQRAENRLNHPAVKMNLGGLLLLSERYEEAIRQLTDAAMHPQLAGGAFHGLGKAYYALNRHKQAINYLLQAAQSVDVATSTSGESEMQIAAVYEQLLELLQNRPIETLTAVNKRFIDLLSGKEWKTRVSETRRQLEDTLRSQGEQGVVDILVANRSNELTEAVARIDRYMRQGLFILAMDEAHRAVEYSPFYLPVHVRMAEIMMREGRVRQAINKYNMIAKTYLVRGENDRAASILSEVLEMAPLDISVRESLIELLESEERWDEALDQYVDLADTHHQLGNFDMSRDIFSSAERLANRVGASADKVVRIKHRMADIDQMRLDIRRAQKTYEEIIQLAPDDERAHRMLIDIHYRQSNPIEAIKKLDALLRIFAKNKQSNRITQLLEEMVTTYPNDTGLRSRLAAIYTQLKRKEDAIKQLDALGELQLEAGLHQEATQTIRQIINLNPDGVEDYKKLLMQLGG